MKIKKVILYPAIVAVMCGAAFGISSGIISSDVKKQNDAQQQSGGDKPTGVINLESLEIVKNPTKTEYTANEFFDSTGIEIQANYSDGTKKILSETSYKCSKTTRLGPEDTKVTFTFKDKNVDLPITVTGKYSNQTHLTISNGFYNTYTIEAESADLTYCAIPSGYGQESNIEATPGASNGKALGCLGQTGNRLIYIVNSAEKIKTSLYLSLAFAQNAAVSFDSLMRLSVNGKQKATGITFNGAGWTAFNEYKVSTDFDLEAGENSIIIDTILTGSVCNIDYLKLETNITDKPLLNIPNNSVNTYKIEAEVGDLSKCSVPSSYTQESNIEEHTSASNGKFLGCFGKKDNEVSYKITSADAYKCNFGVTASYGVTPGINFDDVIEITLNGQKLTTSWSIQTTSWYTWATLVLKDIQLAKGVNVIKFKSLVTYSVPNIDYLSIIFPQHENAPITLKYEAESLDLSDLTSSYAGNPMTESGTDTNGNPFTAIKDYWRVAKGKKFGFKFNSPSKQEITLTLRVMVSADNCSVALGQPYNLDNRVTTSLNGTSLATNMAPTTTSGWFTYQSVSCKFNCVVGENTVTFTRIDAVMNFDWFSVAGLGLTK